MPALSDTRRNSLLLSETSGTLFLALTTQPVRSSDTGLTLSEPSYPGYVRAEVAPEVWDEPNLGSTHNVDPIVLPSVTSGGFVIVGFALCDFEVGGEVRWFGAVTPTAIDALDPDPPTIPRGSLVLALQ